MFVDLKYYKDKYNINSIISFHFEAFYRSKFIYLPKCIHD